MGTGIIASNEELETNRSHMTCSRQVGSCRDGKKDDSSGSKTQTQVITFTVFADQMQMQVSNARSL